MSVASWRTCCFRRALGGDPFDVLLDPLGLEVMDLAKEFPDAGPLGEDLGVGGLERVLGVQRTFAPDCLALVVLVGKHLTPAFAGLGHGSGDCSPGALGLA